MTPDALRRVWPEQLLTGRYSFRTRQRDGVARGLLSAAAIATDGLIDADWRHVLHIRVDDQPVLTVLNRGGPRIVVAGQVLLLLRERPVPRPRTVAALFAPRWYEVVDCRLGMVIGVLATTGGFVRPARTAIYDPAHRLLGCLVQPLGGFLPDLMIVGPLLRPVFGRTRYHILVGRIRIATIRRVPATAAYEYEVDVTRAAGLLDPRLILACALHRLSGLSGY